MKDLCTNMKIAKPRSLLEWNLETAKAVNIKIQMQILEPCPAPTRVSEISVGGGEHESDSLASNLVRNGRREGTNSSFKG